MATTPQKPTATSGVPSSKPNPLHGAPSKAGETVEVMGSPPSSDMAPVAESLVEASLPDSTKAEMEAGKHALDHADDRTRAETEAGRQLLSRFVQRE